MIEVIEIVSQSFAGRIKNNILRLEYRLPLAIFDHPDNAKIVPLPGQARFRSQLEDSIHFRRLKKYVVPGSPVECFETILYRHRKLLMEISEQLRHLRPITDAIGKRPLVESDFSDPVTRAGKQRMYFHILFKQSFDKRDIRAAGSQRLFTDRSSIRKLRHELLRQLK